MNEQRRYDLDIFYDLLDQVIEKFPCQSLDRLGKIRLPLQGVYFFFENGELRENNIKNRVVRIGTHAALAKSNATLYSRLYNHKGARNFTGNHRASVFRELIGFSLICKEKLTFQHWGDRSKKNDKQVKTSERDLEIKVSTYLQTMSFTVLEVIGSPSKGNDRALIEENSIAILSNFQKAPIDQASKNWLGTFSVNDKVIASGLWNSKWTDKIFLGKNFFQIFEKHLRSMISYR